MNNVLTKVAVALAFPALATGAPPDAVRVAFDVPRLTLGTGAGAVVRIEAGGGETPRVEASVGSVEGLRAVGPGRYEARYVPPEDAYPQVAIVSAIAGGAFGSATLPLVGQGEAIVRTTPRASIRVEVAGAPFGPAVADALGVARVPILVPPGTRVAMHRGRPIAIPAPEPKLLHAAVDRDAVRADVPAEVAVWIVATDEDGSPGGGRDVSFEASHGAVAEPQVIAPGVLALRWTQPAGASGTAVLRARRAGRAASVAEVRVDREPGPAARVELVFERGAVSAGDAGPVPFSIVARDAAGNVVARPPAVEPSFGSVERLAGDAHGVWRGLLAVPASFGGRRRAELVARSGGVEARAALELVPGRPTRLAVEVPPGAVTADCGSDAVLRVVALDAHGNPADAAPPSVRAVRGTFSAAAADPGGGWHVAWRPPAARESWVEEVEVEAGALHAKGRIPVEAPSRFALAPSLGFAFGTGGLRSPFVGFDAARWASWRGEELALALGAGWLRFDRTDALPVAGGAALHGRAELAEVVLSGLWRREGRLGSLWAGAGAGAVRYDSALSVGALPASSAAAWAPTAQLRLGVGRRTRLGTPFLESRLRWFGDPKLETLSGSFTAVTLSVGWNLEL